MKKTLLIAALAVAGAGAFSTASTVSAQVAGSTTIGVIFAEMNEVVMSGWSAKKSLLGKTVYNERNEKVGNVEDLIISPDKKVSYVIVGAGGFIGMGRHDVAIPFTQISEREGKIILPGATKDVVKAMPQFDYATDTTRRDQFVASAEQDIAKAKVKMADFENNVATLNGEAKTKMDQQVSGLKQDLRTAEDKLATMKKAGAARWKAFEADMSVATARLRKWVATTIA
jgi:sporulation protein YlmC with PRC-barrel domain